MNEVDVDLWDGKNHLYNMFYSKKPFDEFVQSLKSFPLEFKMGFNGVLRDELIYG